MISISLKFHIVSFQPFRKQSFEPVTFRTIRFEKQVTVVDSGGSSGVVALAAVDQVVRTLS
jgi:hypothetical protein